MYVFVQHSLYPKVADLTFAVSRKRQLSIIPPETHINTHYITSQTGPATSCSTFKSLEITTGFNINMRKYWWILVMHILIEMCIIYKTWSELVSVSKHWLKTIFGGFKFFFIAAVVHDFLNIFIFDMKCFQSSPPSLFIAH